MIRTPVADRVEVVANIRAFVRDVAANPDLQTRLGHVHAWYALQDAEQGWLFGPSKFVGYTNNTAENYLKTYRSGADGRETETVLARWFAPVDPESPLGRELSTALARFLGRWGRVPRRGARISIVAEDEHTAATFAASSGRNQLERISMDPTICGGRPRIKGTRMRVSDIVDMLAAGATRQEILADFPYIVDEDISAALTYAARATDHRVIQAA